MSLYEYMATVVSVHDGDTATFDIDLGFRVHTISSLRLDGINAPELGSQAGTDSRDWLRHLLPAGTKVLLATTRNQFDKYGRYLARVYLAGVCVNTQMVTDGHAVAWDGTGAKP